VLQPDIVDVRELPDFVRAHPRSALLLRAYDQGLLESLGRPLIHEELPGGLTVACL
jgi:hypothetical protein